MGPAPRLIAILLAAIMIGASAGAQTTAGETHRRIAEAGFIPLNEMTFGGRDVRRVLLADPYGILPIPGIEIERHKDRRVSLRGQYLDWTGPAYSLSADEWARLALLEASAFAPASKNSFKGNPDVVVHCWSGLIEASPTRAAAWSGCNSGTQPAQAYTEAVLMLAMDKKQCSPSTKTMFWRFSECFDDEGKLDDPALEERFAALRNRWAEQRQLSPAILAEARRALKAAREDRVPARLEAARSTVFAFGQHLETLRGVLRSSYADFPQSSGTNARSAAILAQARRRWADDISSGHENYIRLLEELARLLAGAPLPARQRSAP